MNPQAQEILYGLHKSVIMKSFDQEEAPAINTAQLNADISIKFAEWQDEFESRKFETVEKAFEYFITNIYQK